MHSSKCIRGAFGASVKKVRLLPAYRHIPGRAALSRKYRARPKYFYSFAERVPSSELTLDHVMPRSRGGRSSGKPVVPLSLQQHKGDRTQAAGLRLCASRAVFALHTPRQLMRFIGYRDERA
jgi:hypothetical protein